MKTSIRKNKLDYVMGALDIYANALAEKAGVNHSLITKWRRGDRKMTKRSNQLRSVAEAIFSFDQNNFLKPLYTPYLNSTTTRAEALVLYLLSEDLPGLEPVAQPKARQTTGEYTVTYQAYLGVDGFNKAILRLMEFVNALPPGQEVFVACYSDAIWVANDPAFVASLLEQLHIAFARKTHVHFMHHRGFAISELASFPGAWLPFHMQGFASSYYYTGPLPAEERITVYVKDYVSLHMKEDPEVEDNMFITVHSDPYDIRLAQAMIDTAFTHAEPLHFAPFFSLASPPTAQEMQPFDCITRLPCFGVITKEEAMAFGVKPTYAPFFDQADPFAAVLPAHVFLCKEDIIDALSTDVTLHPILTQLAGKDVFITKAYMQKLLERLLAKMHACPSFEVSLLPKSAFEKLQMELVIYKGDVLAAWLQDFSTSFYSEDAFVCASMRQFAAYTWQTLMLGWTRQTSVIKTIKEFIEGDLKTHLLPDSPQVRNWAPFDAYR